ncbi:MAG: hypothetical protein ACLPWO_05355 [Thermoplasmata archaeon]
MTPLPHPNIVPDTVANISVYLDILERGPMGLFDELAALSSK